MIAGRLISGAATLALLLMPAAGTAHAQSAPDSLAMERRIAAASTDATFPEGARALVLARLGAGDHEDARRILAFMERRTGYAPSPWLSSRERLTAEALAGPLELIRNRSLLENLLIRDRDNLAVVAFTDPVGGRMRELMRQTIDGQLRAISAAGATPAELRFGAILLNWLTVRGYRPRMDLNARIDAFASEFPDDPLVRLASGYLYTYYRQSTIGGAFTAGYTAGATEGRLGEIFSRYGAPSIAGELFYGPVTLTAQLLIGVADAPEPFEAGGTEWESGSTSLLIGELTAGYEIRFGRFWVTPSGGLAIFSAAGAHATEDADPPRTDFETGWGANLGFGYRIPSDVGPHFDFRGKIGYLASGLDRYDPTFEGSIRYLQIGFALVQRPWRD